MFDANGGLQVEVPVRRSSKPPGSQLQHTSQAVSLVHQLEGFVNLRELHLMRDVLVDLHLPFHVLLNELGYLGLALPAPEGCAHPLPACHELEWPSGDLLASGRYADDDALPPATVCALES